MFINQHVNKANAGFAKSAGLDSGRTLEMMRLLALASLGGVEVRTYADVAQALQIDQEEDVERWVIKAIGAGIVEAKMDQVNKTVVVSRCAERGALTSHEEWKAMREQLGKWRNSFAGARKAVSAGLIPTPEAEEVAAAE
jgi:translation initiation factor 3 subunit M